MKKILRSLSAMLLAVTMICTFYVQSHAIRYKDGRYITNVQIHEFVKKLVTEKERYKEIEGEKEICFDRIAFSFTFIKQNNTVNYIEVLVPVNNEGTAIIFSIYLHTKKDLHVLELINLFLNSNEFNEQDFDFTMYNSVRTQDWCGNTINKYDDMFSVATDVTEENWREKFLDPRMLWGCGPTSLLFFEIHPGEKVFVAGYDEDDDE